MGMPFAGISHVGLAAVGTTRSVRTVSQEGLRAGGVRQGIPAMDGSESKNTKIIFAAALAVACWGILLSAATKKGVTGAGQDAHAHTFRACPAPGW